MDIQGLQKMTLLDFPGKVACTVFLGGCNFRCPFCHNFGLAAGECAPAMSEKGLFEFLEHRGGLLDGVAITGGEPCLRSDLPALLERIKQAGFEVKLDTNGSKPDMLAELVDRQLVDYVAMDIKAGRANYARVSGVADLDLDLIEKSVKQIMSYGIPYEFRTTVVGGLHTEEDFEDIGRWLAGSEKYFLQAFVASDEVPDKSFVTPSLEQLETYRKIVSGDIAYVGIRGIEN